MILVTTVALLTLAAGCNGIAKLLDYTKAVDISTEFTGQDESARTALKVVSDVQYFGKTYTNIRIFESGVVELVNSGGTSGCNPFAPCPAGEKATAVDCNYIAVYWRRVVLGLGGRGRITFEDRPYKEPDDSKVLNDVTTAFSKDPVDESQFKPKSIIIVTWVNVAAFDEDLRTLRNTFQLVILSDSTKSFGVFLFNDIQYFAEQEMDVHYCTAPAKVGIRSDTLTYWINDQATRFEHGKRIPFFSNIRLYDPQFLGRYCLRFYGDLYASALNPAVLFPRPAPALQQNCADLTNPICNVSVPDSFCINKLGEHRHPNLCSHFVYCNFDEVLGIGRCPGPDKNSACPEGMTWNAHNRLCSCNNEENCNTAGLYYGKVNPTTSEFVTSEFVTPRLSVVLDCEYRRDGNYINFDNCASYWACSNKRSIKMFCPTGLKFNPRGKNDGGYLGFCDYPSKVDCTRRAFIEPN